MSDASARRRSGFSRGESHVSWLSVCPSGIFGGISERKPRNVAFTPAKATSSRLPLVDPSSISPSISPPDLAPLMLPRRPARRHRSPDFSCGLRCLGGFLTHRRRCVAALIPDCDRAWASDRCDGRSASGFVFDVGVRFIALLILLRCHCGRFLGRSERAFWLHLIYLSVRRHSDGWSTAIFRSRFSQYTAGSTVILMLFAAIGYLGLASNVDGAKVLVFCQLTFFRWKNVLAMGSLRTPLTPGRILASCPTIFTDTENEAPYWGRPELPPGETPRPLGDCPGASRHLESLARGRGRRWCVR